MATASAALTPARALRRSRRLDPRALAGLLLLLVATGGSVLFWRSVDDTQPVLVATRDLPPGATLAAGDVAVARLRADATVLGAALPADALEPSVGRQLAEPV